MTATLTVVIPTYRRPEMLRRAIASVVRQRSGARVSVYDNGADRETKQVTEDFARHGHAVHYHAHDRNIGANANFAYALDHVQTEFFAILSDDDLLLPGGLQRAVDAFAAHPEALFVASPVLLVDPTGRVLRVVGAWPPGLYDTPDGLLELAEREHFTWTGTAFRRAALEVAGNLDEETGLLSDLDFLLRVASRGAFAVIDEPGGIFAWHPSSPSSLPSFEQFWPAWGRIVVKLRADESLPERVRSEAADRFEARLPGKLLLVGLFSSSRGMFADAEAAADLLARRYSRGLAASVIRLVAWTASRSTTFRNRLFQLANIVRWPPRRRMRAVQARFDREFMEMFNISERQAVPRWEDDVENGGRKDSAA
jgi:glycosyltransferase involved in cell wall biosynthesis